MIRNRAPNSVSSLTTRWFRPQVASWLGMTTLEERSPKATTFASAAPVAVCDVTALFQCLSLGEPGSALGRLREEAPERTFRDPLHIGCPADRRARTHRLRGGMQRNR